MSVGGFLLSILASVIAAKLISTVTKKIINKNKISKSFNNNNNDNSQNYFYDSSQQNNAEKIIINQPKKKKDD